MGVLEILQLQLKPTISPSGPIILATLQKERKQLKERVQDTQSRFFQAIEDPSIIYILGLWPSLEKHRAFLSSPLKAEIIKSHLFNFKWMLHIPLDTMGDLPLDAPLVALSRYHVKGGEHVTAHKEITEKYWEELLEITKPYKAVIAWKIDVDKGKQENIVIDGWQTKEKHLAFGDELREKHPDYASLEDHWDGFEVHYLKDLER